MVKSISYRNFLAPSLAILRLLFGLVASLQLGFLNWCGEVTIGVEASDKMLIQIVHYRASTNTTGNRNNHSKFYTL